MVDDGILWLDGRRAGGGTGDVLVPFDRDVRRSQATRRVTMTVCEACLCPSVLIEDGVEYCAGCDRRIATDA